MPLPSFLELEWFWGKEESDDGFTHASPQRFYMTADQEASADWRIRVGDFFIPVHSQVLALFSTVMADLLSSSVDASEPIMWENCTIFHALVFLRLIYTRPLPAESGRAVHALLHSGHLEGVMRLCHMLGADSPVDLICNFVVSAHACQAPLLVRSAERLGSQPFFTACNPAIVDFIDKLRHAERSERSKRAIKITARCLALLGPSPGLRAAAALAIDPTGRTARRIDELMANLQSEPYGVKHVWRIENFDARVAAEFLPGDALESPWFHDFEEDCEFRVSITPVYRIGANPASLEAAEAAVTVTAGPETAKWDGVSTFYLSFLSVHYKSVACMKIDAKEALSCQMVGAGVKGMCVCQRTGLMGAVDPDGSLLVTVSVDREEDCIEYNVRIGCH